MHAIIHVHKYAGMQVSSMQALNYAIMQVHRYPGTCKYEYMQICKYANIEEFKYWPVAPCVDIIH